MYETMEDFLAFCSRNWGLSEEQIDELPGRELKGKIRQFLAAQQVEAFIHTAPKSELIKLQKYMDQAIAEAGK